MRIVKNLFCFYLVLISFVYTQEVFLSITNLDSTGLEITMINADYLVVDEATGDTTAFTSGEVGGFQFDLDSSFEDFTVNGASGVADSVSDLSDA